VCSSDLPYAAALAGEVPCTCQLAAILGSQREFVHPDLKIFVPFWRGFAWLEIGESPAGQTCVLGARALPIGIGKHLPVTAERTPKGIRRRAANHSEKAGK
jgi:hypothetical protein